MRLVDLRPLQTKEHLLTYLGLEERWFDEVVEFDPRASSCNEAESVSVLVGLPIFFRHEIPKRNPKRGTRIVWEAGPSVTDCYKSLARRLDLYFRSALSGYPHPAAFGFLRGGNTRDNAACHAGRKLLLRSDIADFFPSISQEQIAGVFEKGGVDRYISGLLASFCCIGGELPLGLATSPVLSNAICVPMDQRLDTLANSVGATYSRYADDLSFSSDSILPDPDVVAAELRKEGFSIALEKTRITKNGQAHYVTGLSVSDPNGPHAPRAMKRALRQELRFARKFGLLDHIARIGISDQIEGQRHINRLDGLVKYVAYQEPRQAQKLNSTWYEILRLEGLSLSFPSFQNDGVPVWFYLDETEFSVGGESFLALGMSVSYHQQQLCDATVEILHRFLADPYSDGAKDKKEVLRKKGMHFADATIGLRTDYLKALQRLPFRGYIGYARLREPKKYKETYLRILSAMLRRRLISAPNTIARFSFEENEKLGKKAAAEAAVTMTVEAVHHDLKKDGNRCPSAITVVQTGKSDSGVSVPDFLLGVFRGYQLLSDEDRNGSKTKLEHLMFERLRDKIRVICDMDSGREFGRRDPL